MDGKCYTCHLHAIKKEQGYSTEELEELETILTEKSIRTFFQPIVSLTDAVVLGYEALSRGPRRSLLEWPDKLFKAGEKYNKVWELDLLCRARALENALEISSGKMLFLNIDPKIIDDERFEKGLTKVILKDHPVGIDNIVFEITEKTAIEDYRNFRKVLENYISQGYKIAIDDTGSGWSGLKMLAETRPQYIKIDMDLVRDIDKDSLKQALMRSFCDFAAITNMKVVAEGIETEAELDMLISIGVPYGQGYFLQRPVEHFIDMTPAIEQLILDRNRQKREETFHTSLTMPIGEIARRDEGVQEDISGRKMANYFASYTNLMGVTVLRENKPVGLMMKNSFFANLATQYGVSLYANRPVSLIMDRNPLIVDYNTPLEKVTKFAVSRSEEHLYDYIVVTQKGEYYGITSVKCLLEKTTQLEINRAKHTNPLSGLPGNLLIEEKLKYIIEHQEDAAVLYFDLDSFKAYNDVYGFEKGDKMICLVGQMIQYHVSSLAGKHSFVGHIGGDDFIAIVDKEQAETVCSAMIDRFDREVKNFYTQQDWERGFIIAKNRHGYEERFPIVALSIAVIITKNKQIENPMDLGEKAGLLKKECKLNWQSCYVMG